MGVKPVGQDGSRTTWKVLCFPATLGHNLRVGLHKLAASRYFETSNPQGDKLVMTQAYSETDSAVFFGLGLVAPLVALGLGLALYLFSSYCHKLICEKGGVTPGALVWIPIVRVVPLLEVGKMPVWMIILFLVPIANFIVFFMMWAKICEARGHSPWLVLLFLVPIANIVLIPYLAFSK